MKKVLTIAGSLVVLSLLYSTSILRASDICIVYWDGEYRIPITYSVDEKKDKLTTAIEYWLDDPYPATGILALSPKGTKLRGVGRDNNTVIVNLSKEFLEDIDKYGDFPVWVTALEDTLFQLPGVTAIQILVEGKKVEEYAFGSLGKVILKKEDDLINPGEAGYGLDPNIKIFVNTYYVYVTGKRSLLVPFTYGFNSKGEAEEEIFNRMLETPKESYFQNVKAPFPNGTRIIDIKRADDNLIINFSQSLLGVLPDNIFFDDTLQVITSTASEIRGVKYVTLQVEGKNINKLGTILLPKRVKVPANPKGTINLPIGINKTD